MRSCNLSENICVFEINQKKVEIELKKACINSFFKSNNVNAMIFSRNFLSVEGLYCVTENKVRIPEDLGIIGFDGGNYFDLFPKPIAYIRQPIEDMANKAVKVLMYSFIDDESLKTSNIILKSKLIIRNSC